MAGRPKGYRVTEETKEKIRLSNTGKIRTLEQRLKLSLALKGRVYTQEYKDKMSAIMKKKSWMIGNYGHSAPKSAFKKGHKSWLAGTKGVIKAWNKGLKGFMEGRKFSKEHRQKIGDANRGANSYMWRGGVPNKYPIGWNEILKESIRARDNDKCQICGCSQLECSIKLHIHHIDYNPKNLNSSNLISLCASCHVKTNTKRSYWMNYFNDKMEIYYER